MLLVLKKITIFLIFAAIIDWTFAYGEPTNSKLRTDEDHKYFDAEKAEKREISTKVNRAIQSPRYLYNAGLFLKNGGFLEKSMEIFENLLPDLKDGELYPYERIDENGFVLENKEPIRNMVTGQLVLLYYQLNLLSKTEDLLEKEKNLFIVPYTQESQNNFLDSLNELSWHMPSYSVWFKNRTVFAGTKRCIAMAQKEDDKGNLINEKRIGFYETQLYENISLPIDLDGISLASVKFINGEGDELRDFNVGNLVKNIKTVKLACSINLRILWGQLKSVNYLFIENCEVILEDYKLSPTHLYLDNVLFSSAVGQYIDFVVNNFVNFNELQALKIITANYWLYNSFGKIYLNMNESIKIDLVDLNGRSIIITDWETAKWSMGKLTLTNIPFIRKTQLEINKLQLRNSDFDISVLPNSVENLDIVANHSYYFEDGETDGGKIVNSDNSLSFPNLKTLSLSPFSTLFSNSSNFPNLSRLTILSKQKNDVLNLKYIPDSVRSLDLYQYHPLTGEFYNFKIVGDEIKELDKLTLKGFEDEQVLEVLPKFSPAYIEAKINKYTDRFVDILKFPFKQLAVCSWKMSDEDFQKSAIAKYVDKNGKCYVFGGRAVESIDKPQRQKTDQIAMSVVREFSIFPTD